MFQQAQPVHQLDIHQSASRLGARLAQWVRTRPEILFWLGLLVILNSPLLVGMPAQALSFNTAAVEAGQWWRLFTHPFVHVTWYHLLLDGSAFLTLYYSLIENSLVRRTAFVLAAAAGSLAASILTPHFDAVGLCGLSGIAHGLMVVSALEMMVVHKRYTFDWNLGAASFLLVTGKAALEAVTGKMFFTFLHFGLMGTPVAVSHAGGVLGGLIAFALLQQSLRGRTRQLQSGCGTRGHIAP